MMLRAECQLKNSVKMRLPQKKRPRYNGRVNSIPVQRSKAFFHGVRMRDTGVCMAVIHKSLLQFIFSGSYMERWNDKLRPTDLCEVDKQAHKMIVAWLLCHRNRGDLDEDAFLNLELNVIEGGIFEYFFRLVVTDIKPPVFYRIKSNPEHFAELTKWALKELEPHVKPVGDAFWEKFSNYVRGQQHDRMASRILDAAHLYASYWEFRLLRGLNSFDEEMPEIEANFIDRLREHADIAGVSDLLGEHPDSALHGLANLCGQLRFQKRWSQTPRIPKTSVIGHMFIVACYAYFFSVSLDACQARLVNNFVAGLLHDLPEVLTRDIISPVKKSIEGLDAIIKNYENESLDRRILNPLKRQGYTSIVERLTYYLGLEGASEFTNTIKVSGATRDVDFDLLHGQFNENRHDPKDGELLKMCDYLAAFLEAYVAIRHGVASDQLHQGLWRLRNQNRHKILGPLHFGSVFADFD